MISKYKFGQLVVANKIITQEQLNIALEEQKKTGEMLGITLQRLGFVDSETVYLPIIAHQFGIEFVRLKELDVPPTVIGKIPAKFASHYKIIPVKFENDTLYVAMNRPFDIHLLDEVSLVVDSKIEPVLASEQDIIEAIRKYYGVGAATIEQMMDTVTPSQEIGTEVKNIEDEDSEASISNFINQILLEAYKDRATDIHIEPFEDELKVRYRVDGILYDAKVPSNIVHFKDSINSRIKILSNLNIAEKRLPQDGRFKVRVGKFDLDLRVSFIPAQFGESVVIRILNSARLFKFDELGLADFERKILESLIEKPHGIIFITGPTGSGKTTTLYSCLSRVNKIDRKIITIEDPVEYQIKGITQIQINPQIGLTFASGLRSMLRHDPDIMMVGEVRDIETAEIAIRVALTGHLVFSTLHTNDAASAVSRLVDMGAEPYLISSSVEAIIAQRLVRKVCPKCKQPAKVSSEILHEFELNDEELTGITAYEGKGCEHCLMTGFVGREAIYEFLVLNEELRDMVVAGANSGQVKKKALEMGMRTLRQCGWEKVKSGITTPGEVIRVTQEASM